MSEVSIERLNLEISANATVAAKGINELATSVGNLKGAVKGAVPAMGVLRTQIQRLASSVPQVNQGITSMNRRLTSLSKKNAAITGTATAINQLTTAGKQAGTAAVGLKSVSANSDRAGKSTATLGGFFSTLSGKIFALLGTLYLVRRAFGALKSLFDSTTKRYSDLIEATNLFEVSMKELLPQAEAFRDRISKGIGADPKDLMTFQGIFFQIGKSMGIPIDKAYLMSEGLTQLAYDFASFRNMEPDYVFTKLKGAIVGEARAMRELGVDITQAALQEEAHRLGINAKVKTMTQAQKAQLRYNVIMRNSTDAQGDMARTLSQPANMMRLFHAQVLQAARMIGAMFIPALQAVLPWLIFLAKYTYIAFQQLASLFGIKMPEFVMPKATDSGEFASDLSDGAKSMDKTAKGAGSAAKAMKKMKDYTLGIDELNILQPETNAGGGGGGGGGGGAVGAPKLDIPLPNLYDFFKDMLDPFKKIIDGIKEKLKPFTDWLVPLIQKWRDNFINFWKAIKPMLVLFGKQIALLWTYYLKPTVDLILALLDVLWDAFVGGLKIFIAVWMPAWKKSTEAIEKFGPKFRGWIENAIAWIYRIKAAVIVLRDRWSANWQAMKEKLQPVADKMDNVKDAIATLKVAVQERLGAIKDKWVAIWSKIGKALPSWGGLKSGFKAFINMVISGVNKLIPATNKLVGVYNRLVPGKKLDITPFQPIPLLARGGTADTGSLFIAGEKGPELTGTFRGNANTVMPLENSGFVEAVARAVYGAVSSAMAQAESGGSGDVYLDGKKVGSVLRESDRRTGVASSLVRVSS